MHHALLVRTGRAADLISGSRVEFYLPGFTCGSQLYSSWRAMLVKAQRRQPAMSLTNAKGDSVRQRAWSRHRSEMIDASHGMHIYKTAAPALPLDNLTSSQLRPGDSQSLSHIKRQQDPVR
jgi:hypothetical protein